MNPTLIAGAAALAIGLATGWAANGWRLNTEIAEMRLAAANQAETLRLASQIKINQSAATYVAKSAKAKTTVQANQEKVDQYAPTAFPPLPGSFRLWHDAAADGEALGDTPRTDAATVSLKSAETTLANNYADCRDDKERLRSMQEIIRAFNGE